MRAAFYNEAGPAKDVISLGEFEKPNPEEDEVLIKIHASGVNPSDIKSRTIMFDRVKEQIPIIPHYDGAGVVEAIGKNVSDFSPGDRVWLCLAQWRSKNGTCADYVAISQDLVFPLPDGTSFNEGACVGVPVLTAMHAISLLPSLAGKSILVTGGATSVGNYAIQLAKLQGAHVVTTIGGEKAAAIAESAGADEFINYKTEDLIGRIQEITEGAGVDYLIDMDMSFYAQVYPRILSREGMVVVYGSNHTLAENVPTHAFCMQDLTLRGFLLLNLSNNQLNQLGNEASQLLATQKLIHNIGATFPLNQTVEAHEAVEFGSSSGNVIVEI